MRTKLIQLRKRNNLTQKEAAKKANIGIATYIQLETNYRLGGVDLWLKIQDTYHIADEDMWSYIMEGNNNERSID